MLEALSHLLLQDIPPVGVRALHNLIVSIDLLFNYLFSQKNIIFIYFL